MKSYHRVLKYEVTVQTTTGTHISLKQFTQTQADEIGGVLESDGLDIVLAKKLCDMWTRRGKHSDITYSYRIPFCK